MATRTIETDDTSIEQSYFDLNDRTCDNPSCDTDESDCTITVTADGTFKGLETDFELTFCSIDCLQAFLNESFPIENPTRKPDIVIYKPDV